MKWERFTPAEEKKLAYRARRGDLTARNRLAVSLLHISIREAKSHHGSGFDDFVQAGAESLLETVATVHPKRLRLPVRRAQSEEAAQMYKPYAIPYHMISVLGSLSRVWQEKTQELQRLPREEELVTDLEKAIKRRGNFNVKENIHLWIQLLDLPLSLEEVYDPIPAPKKYEDKEPLIEKLQEVFMDCDRKNFEAARLTLGIADGQALDQRKVAKKLGISQRTVGNRVNRFKKELLGNPRVYALFKELSEMNEEEFY